MRRWLQLIFPVLLASALAAHAQLEVKVDEPKRVGQKAVVKLTMKNTFKEKVESARAALFLMDDEGKVVGQSTQWVVGGSLQTATGDRPVLAPDGETTFNFVVPTDKPFTKTKVTFNRLVLERGKSVDPTANVQLPPSRE
jgi:hypothetical protein